MTKSVDDLLSQTERNLKEKFEKKKKESGTPQSRLPSTAAAPDGSARLDSLVLPDEERGRMPFTKDAYLIRENPQLVQWERELRKFLRNLSPQHGHRVSAAMVYEWATGMKIADLMAEEERLKAEAIAEGRDPKDARGRTTWRADVRKLNRLLREYFGKPYMTYIMGRKVPNAFRVPPGWYVYRHRPRTLTLYAEWAEGVKL